MFCSDLINVLLAVLFLANSLVDCLFHCFECKVVKLMVYINIIKVLTRAKWNGTEEGGEGARKKDHYNTAK